MSMRTTTPAGCARAFRAVPTSFTRRGSWVDDAVGVASDLSEGIPVGFCLGDVFGPLGDDGFGPGGPAVDGLVDLGEERSDQDQPGQPVRVFASVLEVV